MNEEDSIVIENFVSENYGMQTKCWTHFC